MSEEKANGKLSVAKLIARDLFLDKANKRAMILIPYLEDGTLSGHGWSEDFVAELVEQHLAKASPPVRDRAALEQLITDAGKAICANNGQCALIEEVLCRLAAVCHDLLKQVSPADRESPGEKMTRSWRIKPHG